MRSSDYDNNLVLGRAYFANSNFVDADMPSNAWGFASEQELSWGYEIKRFDSVHGLQAEF